MKRISPVRRKRESGQAILLLVTALSIVLILAIGWGIDAGQLYAQRQRAQAAADAGAQAGILDIYESTANGGTASLGPTSFTCTTGSSTSPCKYASLNGFGTTNDTISVSFPTALNLSGSGVPNAWSSATGITVKVQRNVSLTLMRIAGFSASTISASATAAITLTPSAIPIVITHPTLAGALSLGGNTSITICGGPSRSIVVNSNATGAFSIGGTGSVDLSKAGPNDTLGNCSTGTGADFASVGTGGSVAKISLGTTGHYVQPATPLTDPLAGLTEPTALTGGPAGGYIIPTSHVAPGVALAPGCPTTLCGGNKGCDIYQSANYAGIKSKDVISYFYPGLYTIDPSDASGFSTASNGDMEMMPISCGVAADADTNYGMVVVNLGHGSFNVGSNGTANLIGAPITSTKYEGVLLWQGRSLTGVSHSLGGGGALSLVGTIYLNQKNCLPASCASYNSLTLGGGSGSGTLIEGQVITNVLNLSGGGSIKMQLSPTKLLNQRQIALVQ